MNKNECKTVDEYISIQVESIQPLLKQLREIIKKTAPEAVESISYQMPAYKLNGALVYFAACKNHIGFYPTATATTVFAEEIKSFKSSKGAIQFPLNQPLPVELIEKIVKHRVNENNLKKPIK
jgi:uncharacterized protein YdhG (YjbR/CyaY superfamily)